MSYASAGLLLLCLLVRGEFGDTEGTAEVLKDFAATDTFATAKLSPLQQCIALFVAAPAQNAWTRNLSGMPAPVQETWTALECWNYGKRLQKEKKTADCKSMKVDSKRAEQLVDWSRRPAPDRAAPQAHVVSSAFCGRCQPGAQRNPKVLYGPVLYRRSEKAPLAVFVGDDVLHWWNFTDFSCVWSGSETTGKLLVAHVSPDIQANGAMDEKVIGWPRPTGKTLTGSAAVSCPIPSAELAAGRVRRLKLVSKAGKVIVPDARLSITALGPQRFKLSAMVFTADKDPLAIIEWLEHMRWVGGVEHFFVFDNGVGSAVARVLEGYAKKGLVTVDSWRGLRITPAGCDPAKCLYNRIHEIILNTAHFKYGHTSRWMAFFDTDEFFIPSAGHAGQTMAQIVEEAARPTDAAVKFRTWPFFRCCPRVDAKVWPAPWMRIAAQCTTSWSIPMRRHEKNVVRPDLVEIWTNLHSMRDKPYFSDTGSSFGKLAHFARHYTGMTEFHRESTNPAPDTSVQELTKRVVRPKAERLCAADGPLADWPELCDSALFAGALGSQVSNQVPKGLN